MTRWERFFVVIQRISSVLMILFVCAVFAVAVWQWLDWRAYQREAADYDRKVGGGFQRTLPYSGQQIETSDGPLIAVFQEGDVAGERVELGGITITDPTSGKHIEIAPDDASVVQFELIFDQGDGGKVVGYLATVANAEQYRQGRQDLVVGALPALTRSVVARNIRFSDLPRVRGDGSVGLLMWPEEGQAYLVAIRLEDGAIIERSKVKLPTLKQTTLSQGTGSGFFQPGRQGMADEAPLNASHDEFAF